MQTRKAELKDNTTWILDVPCNDTLHSGHWSKVQFGTKQKFLQRNNTTLSLVILTWLEQLQQFFLDKTQIRMGTGSFLENILVQPKTFWRILHHWQTSTSANIPHKTIWHKLLKLNNSSHSKKRKESVHHWKNGHYVFYNQTKSFNWRYFMLIILKQHSIGIEWHERNAPLLKSQRRISLYPTLTVTHGTTILRDWILRQTDMKDNQTRN